MDYRKVIGYLALGTELGTEPVEVVFLDNMILE